MACCWLEIKRLGCGYKTNNFLSMTWHLEGPLYCPLALWCGVKSKRPAIETMHKKTHGNIYSTHSLLFSAPPSHVRRVLKYTVGQTENGWRRWEEKNIHFSENMGFKKKKNTVLDPSRMSWCTISSLECPDAPYAKVFVLFQTLLVWKWVKFLNYHQFTSTHRNTAD